MAATRTRAEIRDGARRELAKRSVRYFLQACWPTVEPTRALMPSVAIDGMCAAAQAVADKRIKRLAVSTCPGTSKSIFWAVVFPAWMLARQAGQSRIMVGSYSWAFGTRDSQRCRDLVQSDWYQDLIEGEWGIRDDADRKDDWWTTATGRRLITSREGKSTGERCTMQIMDDALSASEAYSDSAKGEAARWVNEVLPSRLEDQRVDQRVIVGQRLATDDPIANVLTRDWKYLYLPAVLKEPRDRVDPEDEPCVLYDDAGIEVWRDTRAPGQPIVDLLDNASLKAIELDMGPAAFSAQYLQKPQDTSSGIFRVDWLKRRWVPDERGAEPVCDRQVITVDASFKAGKDSDYAVVQRWGARGADRFLLEQWREQAGFMETAAAVKAMAQRHPLAKVLIEEAANGHAIIDQLKREIAGVVAIKPRESGGAGDNSKKARAMSVQGIVASGAVVLPEHAPWLPTWVAEVKSFPAVKNDDQVDAMVYALRELQVTPAVTAPSFSYVVR
jgi:predicted phage terminase large subunit-like protein